MVILHISLQNISYFFLCLKLNSFLDDFYRHSENHNGVACVFSLKNPSYPEYICVAHCAMSSLDVHPAHPHMLAVGLMDGNVAVFNLKNKTNKPSYISTSKNGKHRDIVWQVSILVLIKINGYRIYQFLYCVDLICNSKKISSSFFH